MWVLSKNFKKKIGKKIEMERTHDSGGI